MRRGLEGGGVNIQAIIGLVLLAAVGAYVWHCERTKLNHAVFVADTERLGQEAEAAAEKRAKEDKAEKEKTDAKIKNLLAANKRLAGELRDARSRSSLVPPAAPGAKRPDLACFDRPLVQSALSRFEDEIAARFEECDAGAIALDAARGWAAKVLK